MYGKPIFTHIDGIRNGGREVSGRSRPERAGGMQRGHWNEGAGSQRPKGFEKRTAPINTISCPTRDGRLNIPNMNAR